MDKKEDKKNILKKINKKPVEIQKETLNQEQDKIFFSYIMGILSIVFAIFYSIAGVVIGLIGIHKIRYLQGEKARKTRKLNIIGIVLGIILFVLSAILQYYLGNLI